MYPIFKIAYYCLNQDTLREVKSQKSKVKILHLSESGCPGFKDVQDVIV